MDRIIIVIVDDQSFSTVEFKDWLKLYLYDKAAGAATYFSTVEFNDSLKRNLVEQKLLFQEKNPLACPFARGDALEGIIMVIIGVTLSLSR